MTNGGAHVSVDALGDEPTALPAIQCLRTRGRHLRLGVSSKEQGGTIPLPVDLFVFKELSFIGSFGMQAARFPAMLRMVESGKLHPGKLITGTVAIEEAGAALAGMGKFATIGMTVITKW
jgi:alcohol dehydrogenase